ncbi:1685_t:CDS:1, partial [Gigaspora margarita]
RGQPRLTRTNQSANNSHGSHGSYSSCGSCGNRDNHSKCVTDGSQGRYGSGYNQPHPIPDYSN